MLMFTDGVPHLLSLGRNRTHSDSLAFFQTFDSHQISFLSFSTKRKAVPKSEGLVFTQNLSAV